MQRERSARGDHDGIGVQVPFGGGQARRGPRDHE